ncbi:hypothetical protein EXT70_17560, partial [Dickeya dadantii]|nr:hypothetical protein [Dickeya dadantii]
MRQEWGVNPGGEPAERPITVHPALFSAMQTALCCLGLFTNSHVVLRMVNFVWSVNSFVRDKRCRFSAIPSHARQGEVQTPPLLDHWLVA